MVDMGWVIDIDWIVEIGWVVNISWVVNIDWIVDIGCTINIPGCIINMLGWTANIGWIVDVGWDVGWIIGVVDCVDGRDIESEEGKARSSGTSEAGRVSPFSQSSVGVKSALNTPATRAE